VEEADQHQQHPHLQVAQVAEAEALTDLVLLGVLVLLDKAILEHLAQMLYMALGAVAAAQVLQLQQHLAILLEMVELE
jgi:hypothetical protein